MDILECFTNDALLEIVKNTEDEIVFIQLHLKYKKCKSLEKELKTLYEKKEHVLSFIK